VTDHLVRCHGTGWRAIAGLAAGSLDALLVTSLPNIRYLTGFTGSNALVIVTRTRKFLLTDSRYTEQAKREVDGLRVQECRDWMAKDAAAELVALELETIAFAARRATYSWFDGLRKLGPFTLLDMPDPTNDLRAVKTEGEIESLRKAAALADSAFSKLLPEIRVGMNEAFRASGGVMVTAGPSTWVQLKKSGSTEGGISRKGTQSISESSSKPDAESKEDASKKKKDARGKK
jgi:hypothetical protein